MEATYIANKKQYSKCCAQLPTTVIEQPKFVIVGGKQKNNIVEQNFNDVAKFITNTSKKTVSKKLLTFMNNDAFCNNTIGKGLYGTVYIPSVNSIAEVVTSDGKKHTINVVIKESNYTTGTTFVTEIINNILYIYGDKCMTTEAIILSFINKLWHKGISPHLPYMVGYGCCKNTQMSNDAKQNEIPTNENIFVNKIITEKHGLEEFLKIKLNDINVDDNHFRWAPDPRDQPQKIFKTNLATLHDLLKYIVIQVDNDENVVLPNKEKCNVIELVDYLSISYIHTDYLLKKNNILLEDMHSKNIFMHWLNDNSYMGTKNIGKLKHIFYNMNDKIIKIKTFGVVLKVGDVGFSTVIPRKDIIIFGQANNVKNNLTYIKEILNNICDAYIFFYNLQWHLPYYLYKKTVAFEILTSYPYDHFVGIDPSKKLLKKVLTHKKLLDFYDKYAVDKTSIDKNSIEI